jgi:hypothetical protein
MEERWTRWRSFGTARLDDDLEAPLGLGVYEIRRASDHASLKLSFTTNVAQELSTFLGRGKDQRFFFWIRAPYVNGALEYRFWSVSTRSEAKAALRRVKEQRRWLGLAASDVDEVATIHQFNARTIVDIRIV